MKAIIISDEQELIDRIDSILQVKGIDSIIYRWLLKAMDNVEEIRPDFIIVSACEYPRHWKTLCQFVSSGIGGKEIKIILYERNPLSEEEKEKATALGVTSFFQEPNSLISVLDGLIPCKIPADTEVFTSSEAFFDDDVPTVDNIVQETSKDEKDFISSGILFTNPNTGMVVSGKILSFRNQIISCQVDVPSLLNDLTFGDQIPSVFIEIDEEVNCYSVTILSKIDNELSVQIG